MRDKPLPPEVLADALQGRIHPTSGRLLKATPLDTKAIRRSFSGSAPTSITACSYADAAALCDRVEELEAAITQALVHFGECSIPAAEETLRAALGIPEGP
jgi:hypothetical protein